MNWSQPEVGISCCLVAETRDGVEECWWEGLAIVIAGREVGVGSNQGKNEL